MEKGFNDDELADIMNEIENLEQEFAREDSEFIDKEPSLDEVAHSVMELSSAQDEDHSLLAEVTSMPVENIVPKKTEKKVDTLDHYEKHHNVKEIAQYEVKSKKDTVMNKSQKPASTAMNFSVEGDMKLDLEFQVSGQQISLHISEDGFEIELEGGAKFSLPVGGSSQGSKAA